MSQYSDLLTHVLLIQIRDSVTALTVKELKINNIKLRKDETYSLRHFV